MKKLILLALLPSLASCGAIRDAARSEVLLLWETAKPQMEVYVAQRLAEKSPELLAMIDKNRDNRVSLEEVKGVDFKDPQNWALLVTIIGAALGYRGLKKETGELYDRTHTPNSGSAPQ